jgi:hypothetical protein
MRSIHRFAATSAVIAGLLAIGVVPAIPASASTLAPIPADCHQTGNPLKLTTAITCTARPANQVWEYGAACYIKAGQLRSGYGNEVTGNGTSTITDCPSATNPVFVIIS